MLIQCHIRGLAGLAIPLISIVVSIAYSPWFNIFNNALSDLGDPCRSATALIFNAGLAIGGLVIVVFALVDVLKYNVVLAIILEILGSFLILIGIINDSYGYMHFVVSAIFFISAVVLLAYLALMLNSTLPLISFTIVVSVWTVYFIFRIPKGAAIPETISIVFASPWYLKTINMLCRNIFRSN